MVQILSFSKFLNNTCVVIFKIWEFAIFSNRTIANSKVRMLRISELLELTVQKFLEYANLTISRREKFQKFLLKNVSKLENRKKFEKFQSSSKVQSLLHPFRLLNSEKRPTIRSSVFVSILENDFFLRLLRAKCVRRTIVARFRHGMSIIQETRGVSGNFTGRNASGIKRDSPGLQTCRRIFTTSSLFPCHFFSMDV